MTEREAREVKPHLQQVVADVRDRVEHGEEPQAAVHNAVLQVRNRYADSRRRVDQPNRMVEQVVQAISNAVDFDAHPLRIEALDDTCIDAWVHELDDAARRIKGLARKLAGSRRVVSQ